MDKPSPRIPDRFWSKVNTNAETGCWEWIAARNGTGYASFWYDGADRRGHRWLYELLRGPVDPTLALDHLCRVRHCVNPEHLEPVTDRVNILRGTGTSAANARKTHCKYGHPLSGDNLRVNGRRRKCITCQRRIDRERWANRDLPRSA